MVFSPNSFQPFNPLFAVKEFCVQFYRLAHRRTRLNVQLTHTHGNENRTIFFAEFLNIQQPVLLRLGIRERIVNQIITREIIVQEQLLHGKVVCSGELDDRHVGDGKLVQHGLKLPILVLPEDDPPLIELR